MKKSFAFLVVVLCAGCGYAGAVSTVPSVQEFFVDLRIDTDDTGEFRFNDDGHLGAECRLGVRTVAGNQSSSQPIEGTHLAIRAFQGTCLFREPLLFGFCALTSVQSDMDCKVSQSAVGPGWFVEAGFNIPHAGYLHCTLACFNIVATQ